MSLIDPLLLQSCLTTALGRVDVDALDACDSTNSEIMRQASAGAPAGRVVVADCQSAGRGRRGRVWLSSPERSLTFSLLWRFTGSPARLAGLSLAVGVALAEALTALGAASIGLKWPNDVLLRTGDGDYAKLAGVLVELASDRRGTQAVIGIGLNLLPPEEKLPQPVSALSEAMPALPGRERILAALLDALVVVLDRFAVDGFAAVKSDWQGWHAWQGLEVSILDEVGAGWVGRCQGVAEDGALLVASETGIQSVYAGDVSVRRT